MADCTLIFHIRPRLDLRCSETEKVLSAIAREFPNSGWVDASDRTIQGFHSIQASIDAVKPKDFERFGLTWCAKTTDTQPLVLTVATGGDEFALNSFEIDLSRRQKIPPLSVFIEIVKTVAPFQAFYYFENSEELLRQKVREYGTKRFPVKSLRCVHFFDVAFANKLGGVQRLLAIPNARKTEIANGVLIEFTTNLNAHNEEDIDAQLKAMEFLGMITKQPVN